jgi:hypothetical protein
VAFPRIGFNEGSLLRRTLIHVATMVLGSVAFIGLVSFVLVSIAKGLTAPPGERAELDLSGAPGVPGVTITTAKPGAAPFKPRSFGGGAMGKRGPTVPAGAATKDD